MRQIIFLTICGWFCCLSHFCLCLYLVLLWSYTYIIQCWRKWCSLPGKRTSTRQITSNWDIHVLLLLYSIKGSVYHSNTQAAVILIPIYRTML